MPKFATVVVLLPAGPFKSAVETKKATAPTQSPFFLVLAIVQV
jgi:hypothetical protein